MPLPLSSSKPRRNPEQALAGAYRSARAEYEAGPSTSPEDAAYTRQTASCVAYEELLGTFSEPVARAFADALAQAAGESVNGAAL